MAKEEEVKDAGKEPVKSSKELFLEKFSSRFPDANTDDEDGFYRMLGEEFDRIDRSDKAQKELGELLASDPRSAGFLMVLRKGGNPMEYLIEQYGDDFREALNDEEKAKELSAAFSKYAEKQAKNRELQEQAEKNMQRMLDELDAAKSEGSFTDEDAVKAYGYLYGDGGLLDRIITNDIMKDDWMMLMKAADYDAMKSRGEQEAAQAREEGEIAGRNANIDLNKRKRTKAGNMPANVPSGRGSDSGGKQKDETLEFFDRRRKSVWED